MHKHQIEKEDQDLEVLHKKRKSESIMSEKLNTLSNGSLSFLLPLILFRGHKDKRT